MSIFTLTQFQHSTIVKLLELDFYHNIIAHEINNSKSVFSYKLHHCFLYSSKISQKIILVLNEFRKYLTEHYLNINLVFKKLLINIKTFL